MPGFDPRMSKIPACRGWKDLVFFGLFLLFECNRRFLTLLYLCQLAESVAKRFCRCVLLLANSQKPRTKCCLLTPDLCLLTPDFFLSHFQPILLRKRRDKTIHPQVLNQLPVVVRDVPHGDD